VETEQLEDFVILRSDGSPTYHLSVVVDDVDMGISHVIRGADHLSNTSKHILLFQALGETPPVFCHLPLILGMDKKRLSKRQGAIPLTEYGKQGILPAAMRNYLALLGWSPGGDEEVLSQTDLVYRFDPARINKANAVFDPSKLEWMNKRYLSSLSANELAAEVQCRLSRSDLWDPAWEREGRNWFLGVVELLKSRVEDLNDFADYGRPFLSDDFTYEPAAVEKYLKSGQREVEEKLRQGLVELHHQYRALSPFDLQGTERILREIAESFQIKAGVLIGAVRVATTGRAKAPGIFDVLVTLGKTKTLERLDRLIQYLQ
jgi:glutamyl-tRNA synthetase